MAMVTFSTLSQKWAAHMNAAHEDNQVIVAEYSKKPAAVLISHDLWLIGQERAEEPARFETLKSGQVPGSLKPIRLGLGAGRHTVVTVDGKPKVAFAPYEWAREVFPDLGLPATPEPVGCAMIVYRSARHVGEQLSVYAGSADPDREMDRHLSSTGRARIPAMRRERIRAVVYVHEGVVARVRAVDQDGRWEEPAGDPRTIAPVSDPLTPLQIDRRTPGLGIYPGDKRESRWAIWREYIDLDTRD
ncbi:hypothetical protein [Nocardia jejuensis]|uniref:hypothetical protein n=1 Tax=Nocardia jejuensis TaxID=328049 RepID=UPI000836E381|nr:hypothetical protein [Nocardia jejuensis]